MRIVNEEGVEEKVQVIRDYIHVIILTDHGAAGRLAALRFAVSDNISFCVTLQF